MTKYINRHGIEEEFNGNKIYQAIIKAMKSGSGVYHQKIAKLIKEECEDKFFKKDKVTNNEIDKFVLKQLNEYGQNLTANAYERFKTLKLNSTLSQEYKKCVNSIGSILSTFCPFFVIYK